MYRKLHEAPLIQVAMIPAAGGRTEEHYHTPLNHYIPGQLDAYVANYVLFERQRTHRN